ncbi:hypothetical protein ABDK56_04120 [Sphingomonas sp. ASV193]|uniref:hypothetical protein n=1 Tax=Sphingomonas sp. ASV193 TaxID=3144405 RepID=UPI0032E8A2F8
MYTQQDLDDAVAAGALSADSATALRDFMDRQRRSPSVDEEQFRLITSFNDIFVSIAAAILLFAVGWIAQSIGQAIGFAIHDQGGSDSYGPSPLIGFAIAVTSWFLAEVFTARRRMALPSILLLLTFVGGVLAGTGFLGVIVSGIDRVREDSPTTMAMLGAISAAVAAAAAYLHWRRFHVPITVAAGAASIAMVVLALIASTLNLEAVQSRDILLGFTLLLGVGMFLFAMWWDGTDPSRTTRRSDVAFWLHLLAAPMIVHPVFTLLGLTAGSISIAGGLAVVALYVVLGITALAIDRRALLVSALAYVLYALTELFKSLGAVQLNVALTALVIGSALLMLSAYWHSARTLVVKALPAALQARLPDLNRVSLPQPAA